MSLWLLGLSGLWAGVPAPQCITSTPPEGFVALNEAIEGIRVEPRYHGGANFTEARLPGYGAPGAWMLEEAALALGRVQAERLFVARDDLAVQRLSDPTLPPEQVYGMPVSRRQYYGGFSWFATLVRQVPGSEEFVLSIVVLEDRDLGAGGIPTSPSLEQVLPVGLISGVSGGEIQIPGQPDITTGDWLMLTSSLGLFRWYRVVNSSQDTDFTFVTLEGADIDFNPTTAVLVPGVVGVFEKTIRIEGTSMWDTTH